MKTNIRKIVKKESWKEDLFKYVESVRSRPFKWGSFDCCVFAFNCIEKMTGTNPMKEVGLKNSYKSKTKALEVMGSDLATLVRGHLSTFEGIASIPNGIPMNGDIACIRGKENDNMAVCINGKWMGPDKGGVVAIEKPEIIKIWGIR